MPPKDQGQTATQDNAQAQNQDGLDAQIAALAKGMGVDLNDPANDVLNKGEDDDEDDDEDDLGKGQDEALFDLLKSFPESAAMEESDFLKRLALVLTRSVDNLAKGQNAALDAQDRVNFFMAGAVDVLAKSLQRIEQTLNAIAGNPAGVQGVRAAAQNGALSKAFAGNADPGGQDPAQKKTERARLEGALIKAIQADALPAQAAAHFDRTGTLPPQWMGIAQGYMS